MTFEDLLKNKTNNCLFYIYEDNKVQNIDNALYNQIKDKEIEIVSIQPKARVEQLPNSINYEIEPYCQVVVSLIK